MLLRCCIDVADVAADVAALLLMLLMSLLMLLPCSSRSSSVGNLTPCE
jgi:hypothetical protein